MASYNLLQKTHFGFESPAKVFAKLKSKVQKEQEAMIVKEGVFTLNNSLYNVREQHRGAGFHCPRKKTENDELKEIQGVGSYHNEVQALTLSPILSPQKSCHYSVKLLEENSLTDVQRGRTFLESTAVSQLPVVAIRDQISSNGFIGSSRTPVKMKPTENCGRSVFEKKDAPFSLASVYSPMISRLRKRKLDQRESNTFIRATEERRNPASTQDDTHNNTYMQDWGHGIGFPADQSKITQDETMISQPAIFFNKRCSVLLEQITKLSPAKMFASMKDRENKRQRQEVCNSSRRELFGGESLHESRDTPVPATHSVAETEDVTLKTTPETTGVVNRDQEDSADRPSDSEDSEDTLVPAAPSQPILLEDPLVLNSPQILIPKKDKDVFKRNHWPQQTKFPVESVIYLKKWFLRRNQKGLFVDGIHGEDNIPWNSNIIVERVSNLVLKTVSGRVYILVGKMRMNLASDFPKSFLKKFVSGFPPSWNTLYEKFLSEWKQTDTKDNKVKPEASSISRSVKRRTPKSSNTPPSCSSDASFSHVTRSGRLIKPPLEYWKGGRVLLDAEMNVTIHECYNNSNADVSTVTSLGSSKKPVRVFLPSSGGLKQSKSVKDEEESAPVRKLRALRNRNTAKKPLNLSESTCEVFKVPEQCFGKTRSSPRHLKTAMEKRTFVVSEKQSESANPSAERSVNQTNTSRQLSSSRRTFTCCSESPPDADQTSSHLSSDEEFPVKRKPRGNSKKGMKVSNKSQPDRKSSLSQPSESFKESRKQLRTRGGRTKKLDEEPQHNERRRTKTSSHEATQLDKRRHANKNNTVVPEEEGEDKWTEAELMKLEEAVSYYPKNLMDYWTKVALMVGTRSAEECHSQHMLQGTSQSQKRTKKLKNTKVEPPKPPVSGRPVISARLGTLKRKQQVRQFLEAQAKEDAEDAFSSAYMQKKCLEVPSLCSSEDQDFELSDFEAQTPTALRFPEVKTPRCLHVTPGMMGSPNVNNDDDKNSYRLQRRMKKNQFNVLKTSHSSKRLTQTPSLKRTVRRCGNTENEMFFVREMFPANDAGLSDSEEEEDFYFSDN